MPIGHDAAMKAIAAAEAEAKKNDWLMVIAVVDSGGRLVAFSRMDNAQLGSIDIAMGKAMTANNLRRPTKALQDSVVSGAASNQDAQCAIAGAAAAVGK
jgi:glc operon protein GlcG